MQIQVKQSYKGKNISSLYRFPFVYSKRPNIGPADYWSLTLVLVGDSKAPGSLSESTGLRPHAASVKIDRPIFALASGLKQLAKASCRSPGCLTRC